MRLGVSIKKDKINIINIRKEIKYKGKISDNSQHRQTVRPENLPETKSQGLQ